MVSSVSHHYILDCVERMRINNPGCGGLRHRMIASCRQESFYVDLTAPLNSDDELMMKYNFRFLTDKQYTDSLTDNKHHWFCLHEIFKYEQYDSPDDILFNVVVPELEKRTHFQ